MGALVSVLVMVGARLSTRALTWGVATWIEHMYDVGMTVIEASHVSNDDTDTGGAGADPEVLIAEIAGHLNVQHARLVAVMADVLADDDWVGTGIHTPTQWLAWKAGLSPERARMITNVAERRHDFPVVIGAFERGELTLEQVFVVVTKAPAWADHKVVDFTKAATVHQLRRTITDQFFDNGPTPPEPTDPPVDRVSFGPTTGDRWRIGGNFDIATGQRIEAALTERKDTRYEQGDTDTTSARSRPMHDATATAPGCTSTSRTLTRPRPMAGTSRWSCATGSCVTASCNPCGNETVCRSRSDEHNGSCPPGHGASSNTATAAAGSPAARTPDTSKSTTSSTGSTADRPTPGT